MSYCCFADKQPFGNLFVLQTFADQSDYFAFSGCESVYLQRFRIGLVRFIELLNHDAHHGPVDPDFSGVDFLYRLQKQLGRVLLEHNAHCPATDGSAMQVGILYPSQHQNARVRTGLTKFWKKSQTIVLPKQQIKNDYVWSFVGCVLERFRAISRQCYDSHSLVLLDKHLQSSTDDRVIINNHDANWVGLTSARNGSRHLRPHQYVT